MKRLTASLLFVFAAVAAWAQGGSFTVDAPRVVSTDEPFRIVFTADGRISDFEWPGSDKLTNIWGPQKGSMSSTSIVNGKRTSTHQETLSYVVQATAAGTFTIPAATATIGKERLSTGDFTIEVVEERSPDASPDKGSAQAARSAQAADSRSQDRQAASGTVSNGDIFLKFTLSKSNVVKGEPVVASLKLYTRVDIQAFEDVRFPSFDGFWSKETETPQNVEFVRENVDGVIYNSALLRKYMLIPQQTGRIDIDPAEMVCLVRVAGNSSPASFFDSFFDTYQTLRKRLSTPATSINVRELPAGAPSSFGGGVGNFKMEVSVASSELKAHEASSVIVKISGRGNVSMLEAPHVNFPPDFEIYDIKSTEKISADGTSGSKTFEYPFIPRSHGSFTVDPIRYSYYDIAKGGYSSLASQPLELEVARGQEIEGAGVVMPSLARQGVKNIAEDIRFIHTWGPSLRGQDSFFAASPAFWALIAAAFAAFAAVSLILGYFEKRRGDVAGTRGRKANKIARTRLRQAGDYLRKGLNSAFYEELHKALLGYVADKLLISAADLSKERIAERFASRGVQGEVVDTLINLIEACEQARYAPDTDAASRESIYQKAMEVISELESKVKNPNSLKSAAVIVTALMLSLGWTASAQSVQQYWNEACDAYTQGDFATALESFGNIESMALVSDDLFFNIANCHFKMGDTPRAILYYEKCLKLNPSHTDAQFNSALAREHTLDKIDVVPDFVLVTWIEKAKYLFSADRWAWITVALMFIVATLLVVFRRAGSIVARKVSFVFACIVFALAVCTASFSLSVRNDALAADRAVMMQPVTTVKSSPGEAGKPIFVLHEGSVVNILDNLGEWTLIELADGRQGWSESSALEVI